MLISLVISIPFVEPMLGIISSSFAALPNFVKFIEDFAINVDFSNKSFLAEKLFPFGRDKRIVVDPHRQFGQPIIDGTSINAEVIYSMYKSGEPIDSLAILYDLTEKEVNDAINFYRSAA